MEVRLGGEEMRAVRIARKAVKLAGWALALLLAGRSQAQPTPANSPVAAGAAANAPAAPHASQTVLSRADSPAAEPAPDAVIDPGSEKIHVKPGSIDDVSAVGDRDIGGRGFKNWYSTATEIRIGRLYADQIDRSALLITDPVVTAYVNRIGQNLVRNSDCKVPFTIQVIDSGQINAFALPGGFLFVNSGLIINAGSEAELAGVMAHEIAHVCAHHAMREMTRMNYAQLGGIPLMMIGGWTGYGVWEASAFAVPMAFLEFSREFEQQADYLGVQYMYRAGYDPDALISFFERVQALEKHKPGLVAKAFSDHPQTPERILRTQEEIARILPPRTEYLVTTSEFDDVKARLARIDREHRPARSEDGRQPAPRPPGDGQN
jgi:predicted Zn-dependent protease